MVLLKTRWLTLNTHFQNLQKFPVEISSNQEEAVRVRGTVYGPSGPIGANVPASTSEPGKLQKPRNR